MTLGEMGGAERAAPLARDLGGLSRGRNGGVTSLDTAGNLSESHPCPFAVETQRIENCHAGKMLRGSQRPEPEMWGDSRDRPGLATDFAPKGRTLIYVICFPSTYIHYIFTYPIPTSLFRPRKSPSFQR